MESLDDLDRALIALLRADARLPVASLAQRLRVSRGTVQNRIDKLIERRVLLGFTVRLREDVETAAVRAFMTLEVRAGDLKPVVARLKRLPSVVRIFTTNGRWDLVCEIATGDLAALDAVINDIRAVPGIAHSETSIRLSEL
ncbi:Lrp/AsnC family transcriptional regulator [Salinarimonas ramus]|uniref:HTH asnC-type domain-containing protein n=1 Tax=Salinarimonas ramus TaxID=690164 RepID=A0A917Q4M3_9HYPH|nr:Lrp/AsnC family transcriptional regulator [Salinarimonas ramus]GGK21471.1 hypothetical protein GCM10011322_05210 [Salinarimonas ramus]